MTKTLLAFLFCVALVPFGVGNITGYFVAPLMVQYFHRTPVGDCSHRALQPGESCTVTIPPTLALRDLPPSTIQAGPYRWTTRFTKTGDDFGEIIYRPLELRIGEDLPPDQVKETMLHEIFHVCLFVGGGGTSGPVIHGEQMTDDQFIEATAPTMLQVFRDNPELVAWLARR